MTTFNAFDSKRSLASPLGQLVLLSIGISVWLPAICGAQESVQPNTQVADHDANRPNVLWLVTDEHNFRTLGCYRQLMPKEQAEMWGEGVTVATPNFDRLAAEGLICSRAYATAPVCSPCRAAMITGRYPHATGVPANDHVLDRSVPTIADRLNAVGYRSGFIGKWHLGGTGKPEWSPTVDGGFRFKDFMFNRGHWKKFEIFEGKPRVAARKKDQASYDLAGADETTFSTDFLTDRAIEFVSRAADAPFLLVVSYPDPHGPNTVRAPYDHRFDELRFAPPRTYQTGIPAPKWLGTKQKHPPFRGEQMSRYFGMVQCIDDNIGRLLQALESQNQLDNTLIVMTSDHGDLCYEHDRQNKGNPYEGSARVPLIVRFPAKIPKGSVYSQPVGTVDLTPTTMGLLGLKGESGDQGRNLASAFLTTASTANDVTANNDPATKVGTAAEDPVTFLRNAGTTAQWVAAVDARYKLVLSTQDVPWLFDRQQDPDELLNFYGRPGAAEPSRRLAAQLRDYSKRYADPFFEAEEIADSLTAILE